MRVKESLWARIWQFVRSLRGQNPSRGDETSIGWLQPEDLVEPLKDHVRRSHREIVARIQQMVSVSPTEGRELVQDLHVTKCRSSGVGAARATTNFASGKMEQVQNLLSAPPEELLDENWSAEQMRNLTRTALRDILARR